jgi:hypothetical protein
VTALVAEWLGAGQNAATGRGDLTLDWQWDGDGQDSGDSTVSTQPPRPSLLSLLAAAGVAPDDTLRHAFEEAVERGLRPGEIVLERGWLDADGLARLVASQWGLPFLACESVHRDPASPLSAGRERELGGSVIGSLGGGRFVALAEPTAERLSMFKAALGAATQFAVVTESCLERLTDRDSAEALDAEAEPLEEIRSDALLADLEQATHGLTAARDRIQRLAAEHHDAEQLAIDLRRRVEDLDAARSREQEESRRWRAEFEAERARATAFRMRLSELLAEFED